MPASWTLVRSDQDYPVAKGVTESSPSATQDFVDNFAVRTMFGPVSLNLAQDWPVIASYDELARYAEWTGCRIPTYEEVRSIYLYADQLRSADRHKCNGHSNGVNSFANGVNGNSNGIHGTSNGVKRMMNGTAKTTSHADLPVFRALGGCNVGFQNWHPFPVTPNGDKLAGQGDLGGVWEWTSTPLKAHEGFKAMDIYPGYTSDFFDGKHNIIQGGSWATMPRIAGRTTFVNWYQHNYLYAWAGVRLVRDVSE